MKTVRNSFARVSGAMVLFFATLVLAPVQLSGQGWYNVSWPHRTPVTVYNPSSGPLTDFQVQIPLNSDNFDLSLTLSDGSDLRVTSDDGVTLIPFWIELWDQVNDTASVWVKAPSIPVDSIQVYFYYGNLSPTMPPPVETPPIGPYTRAVSNPIVPAGDPGLGASLLAENIVWDPVSGHYWMVFANYRSGSYGVGLVWSDTPADPTSWNWHGNIYTQAGNGSFAPHIIFENGLWYVFFARLPDIVYITCSTINGTYSSPTTVLSPSAVWEAYRVDEPYVFRRTSDNKWMIVYMGDAGSVTEQVGYATADNITGPYTKFTGNPCIPFGPEGSYDAGTVADPWVYEFQGTYYIGYTVSSTKNSPWSTACATTSDWQSFTKLGIIFPVNTSGWDATNSFRGAVTRIGDDYVFSYTGGSYRMGIATQPVFNIPATFINRAESVFDFYDGFDTGTDPDGTKWTFASGDPSTSTSISGGLLHLYATSTFVRLNGLKSFGMNYLSETRAYHPDQGTDQIVAEVGMAQSGSGGTGLNYSVRIVDDFKTIGGVPSTMYWQRQANNGGTDDFVNMAQRSDRNWHVFKAYRQSPDIAGFQIDNNPVETTNAKVPTTNLVPFLMAYGSGNDFYVDWTRVRKWAGAEPEVRVVTEWTGGSGPEWTVASNWISGFVPGASNNVVIQNVSTHPEISGAVVCNDLMMEPLARITVNSGGSVTAGGKITINTSSTLANGSLVNLGTVNGTVIFNRYLLPKASGGDFQLASSPVSGNTEPNTDDILRAKAYDEVAGLWTSGDMLALTPGRGYNLKQTDTGDGVVTFAGTLLTGDLVIPATSPFIDTYDGSESAYESRSYVPDASSHSGKVRDNTDNWGGGGWNLLGNPFASSMSVAGFISENYSIIPADSQFDPSFVALYLNDGATSTYRYVALSTGWEGGTYLAEDNIQAGQGFFVRAMNDLSEFTFTRDMQVHDVEVPMLKSAKNDERWPGLKLSLKSGSEERSTLIVYGENMTAGLDPGYDVGNYAGYSEIEIYSVLTGKDNGVNFARQALPVSDCNTFKVPVGIDFEKGGSVTFSAETAPIGSYKFWLEDRSTGTFTDLTTKSYTVSLAAKTYGTGRFFIIASTNTPTSVEDPADEDGSLRIWVSGNKAVIKGPVGDKALCEIFNMQGKQILELRLNDSELNTVDLPAGLKGVYVVRVTDSVKTTTRKVAVL